MTKSKIKNQKSKIQIKSKKLINFKDPHIIKFNIFNNYPEIVQGFSTREFGSMRPDNIESKNSLKQFCKALKIDPKNTISMKQIHSCNSLWVDNSQRGQRIQATDSILTKSKQTFLTVLSADCMPVLFYDFKKKVVAAVHAGWRGIYNEILKETVKILIKDGSKVENIFSGIGPCIRSCCYNITEERSVLFQNKFCKFSNIIVKRNHSEFLDMPEIAKQQLVSMGIPEKNIEDCQLCTFDNKYQLFSYRREGVNFGEFIGIIGRI